MISIRLILGTLILVSAIYGCTKTKSNSKSDHELLMEYQKTQREAHISKKVDLLVSLFSDDFKNISSGKITTPTRQESRNRFQSYFDRVEFIAWDDVKEPVIRISKDGTMAYIMVQKFVHLRVPQPDGSQVESKTNFAWMETWEKVEGDWKMMAIASTSVTAS